jgi:hypothetical protein
MVWTWYNKESKERARALASRVLRSCLYGHGTIAYEVAPPLLFSTTREKIMKAWDVYLNGELFDVVFFTADCSSVYVKDSLVNHDGYDPLIRVVPMKEKTDDV